MDRDVKNLINIAGTSDTSRNEEVNEQTTSKGTTKTVRESNGVKENQLHKDIRTPEMIGMDEDEAKKAEEIKTDSDHQSRDATVADNVSDDDAEMQSDEEKEENEVSHYCTFCDARFDSYNEYFSHSRGLIHAQNIINPRTDNLEE